MTQDKVKAFFDMQVPFSFTKRLFKAMLYQHFAEK